MREAALVMSLFVFMSCNAIAKEDIDDFIAWKKAVDLGECHASFTALEMPEYAKKAKLEAERSAKAMPTIAWFLGQSYGFEAGRWYGHYFDSGMSQAVRKEKASNMVDAIKCHALINGE